MDVDNVNSLNFGKSFQLGFKILLVALVTITLGGRVLDQILTIKPAQSASEAKQPKNTPSLPASVDITAIKVKENSPKLQAKGEDDIQQALPTAGVRASTPIASTPSRQGVYNVAASGRQTASSKSLESIVNTIVDEARRKGLPTESLSINLVDLSANRSASYQGDVMRFPASIVKLFWMVELYSGIESGAIPASYGQHDLGQGCKSPICKMIQDSDNESASKVVDLLTDTASSKLDFASDTEYGAWAEKRERLNVFFSRAGYEGISIKHKNFPIPYLGLDKPQGADLRIRGNDPNHPVRNRVSSSQATQLMQDIVQNRAVSAESSRIMMQLLTRYDLQTGTWKQKEYDPIRGFFGEMLPTDAYLASKVGWTSESRQEVAYIKSADGTAQYILTIFADDATYAKDWKIFPEMSKFVFESMTRKNNQMISHR